MGRHLTVSEQWGYTAPLRWAARPAGQAPLSRHIPEQVRRAGHYGHTDTCTRSKGSACLTTLAKMFGFETRSCASGRLELGVSWRAFLGGCVGSRGSRPTWRLRVVFCAIASPFGEIAPPNSPFRPSTAAPAAGLVYAPAYIKSNARGRGWRPAVGLGGAISEKGDENWPEHFRGAAGAFCHCISTAPPPPTSGVWPMMPIRGGLVV